MSLSPFVCYITSSQLSRLCVSAYCVLFLFRESELVAEVAHLAFHAMVLCRIEPFPICNICCKNNMIALDYSIVEMSRSEAMHART
jgi:hypothetical protein